MKLLTKEIKKKMPALYDGEEIPADVKIVQVKFFTPDSNWTWYATEASAITNDGDYIALANMDGRDDIQDVIFFGLVDGLEIEWGYFSLSELESARGPWGLAIERDRHLGRPPMYEARPDMYTKPEPTIKKTAWTTPIDRTAPPESDHEYWANYFEGLIRICDARSVSSELHRFWSQVDMYHTAKRDFIRAAESHRVAQKAFAS